MTNRRKRDLEALGRKRKRMYAWAYSISAAVLPVLVTMCLLPLVSVYVARDCVPLVFIVFVGVEFMLLIAAADALYRDASEFVEKEISAERLYSKYEIRFIDDCNRQNYD